MLPTDPKRATEFLAECFLSATPREIRRLATALREADYTDLLAARCEAEVLAHRQGVVVPRRREAAWLGLIARRTCLTEGLDWSSAELALHFALVGAAVQGLVGPGRLETLIGPFRRTLLADRG